MTPETADKAARARHYRTLRKAGWLARHAWSAAQTRTAWDRAAFADNVRLNVEPDDCMSFDDLCGDTFNPKANPDIPPARLERERKEELERVQRLGIVGMVGQFRNPTTGEWETADSVWGFVGDDWKDSGYDDDIKHSAMAAHSAAVAQANAARHDFVCEALSIRSAIRTAGADIAPGLHAALARALELARGNRICLEWED
jgi:hypothetical protein